MGMVSLMYLLDNSLYDWMIDVFVHLKHMKPIVVVLVVMQNFAMGCKALR